MAFGEPFYNTNHWSVEDIDLTAHNRQKDPEKLIKFVALFITLIYCDICNTVDDGYQVSMRYQLQDKEWLIGKEHDQENLQKPWYIAILQAFAAPNVVSTTLLTGPLLQSILLLQQKFLLFTWVKDYAVFVDHRTIRCLNIHAVILFTTIL